MNKCKWQCPNQMQCSTKHTVCQHCQPPLPDGLQWKSSRMSVNPVNSCTGCFCLAPTLLLLLLLLLLLDKLQMTRLLSRWRNWGNTIVTRLRPNGWTRKHIISWWKMLVLVVQHDVNDLLAWHKLNFLGCANWQQNAAHILRLISWTDTAFDIIVYFVTDHICLWSNNLMTG